VLVQAILERQIIERSIAARTLPDPEIRFALRHCMKERRALGVVDADPVRREDSHQPDSDVQDGSAKTGDIADIAIFPP
jgi:hypothetical protein